MKISDTIAEGMLNIHI